MGYFFVGGAQRSGTTLLQGILCSDETTNPLIYEAYLFRFVVDAYVNGKPHFERRGPDYFPDFEAYRSFHARTALDFLEQTRNRYAPAAHLVLKETYLTMRFPDLHELIPDAKFLLIVRDPRDVAASLIQVGERMKSQGRENEFSTRDMDAIARHYKSFYEPAMRTPTPAFRKNLQVVKYEDLVTDTPTEIERLRGFTGLEFKDLDNEDFWAGSKWDFKKMEEWGLHRPWSSELWGKGMSSDRVGRYREIMTDDEIAAIERQCADVFHLFGYQAGTETAPAVAPSSKSSNGQLARKDSA